jgi:hypothetical protein
VRYTPVVAVLAAALFTAATRAQDVLVRAVGDQLQLAAPSLRFISGKPLDTLRNGTAVAYDVQVSILSDNRQAVLRRAFERFVISYDLWEERFTVTRMRSTRSSASHLTALQAEAWCLDRFAIPFAGLPSDRQLWVRLDIHARNGRDSQPLEDDGLSIGALIELFSRPGKTPGVTQWRADSGPFTIEALRRTQSR